MKHFILAVIAGFVAIISVQSLAMRRGITRVGAPIARSAGQRFFSTGIRKVKSHPSETFTKIQKRHYIKPTEKSSWASFIEKEQLSEKRFKKKNWLPWQRNSKKTLRSKSKLPKGYGGVQGPSLWQQIKSNKWVRRITGFFGIGAGGYAYTKLAIPGNIQDLIQAYDINQFLTIGATRKAIIDIANESEENRLKVGELLLQNYQKILKSPVYAKNAADIFQKFLKDVVPKMDVKNKFKFMENLLLTINTEDNFGHLNNNKFATNITLSMENQLGKKQKIELYHIIHKNLESSFEKDGRAPILLGVLQYNDPRVDKQFRGIVDTISNTPNLLENPEIVFGFCNIHKEIRSKRFKSLEYYNNKGQLLQAIERMNIAGIQNLASMEIEDFYSWSKPKQKALVNYIKLNFEDQELTAKDHLFNIIKPKYSSVPKDFVNNPKMLQLIIDNIKKEDLLKLRNSFAVHVSLIGKRKDDTNRISKTIFPPIDKKLKKMGKTLERAEKMRKNVEG